MATHCTGTCELGNFYYTGVGRNKLDIIVYIYWLMYVNGIFSGSHTSRFILELLNDIFPQDHIWQVHEPTMVAARVDSSDCECRIFDTVSPPKQDEIWSSSVQETAGVKHLEWPPFR
jgi:hypothetical protein